MVRYPRHLDRQDERQWRPRLRCLRRDYYTNGPDHAESVRPCCAFPTHADNPLQCGTDSARTFFVSPVFIGAMPSFLSLHLSLSSGLHRTSCTSLGYITQDESADGLVLSPSATVVATVPFNRRGHALGSKIERSRLRRRCPFRQANGDDPNQLSEENTNITMNIGRHVALLMGRYTEHARSHSLERSKASTCAPSPRMWSLWERRGVGDIRFIPPRGANAILPRRSSRG